MFCSFLISSRYEIDCFDLVRNFDHLARVATYTYFPLPTCFSRIHLRFKFWLQVQFQYLWSGEETGGTFSNLIGFFLSEHGSSDIEDHLEKVNQSVGRQTWSSFLRLISKRKLVVSEGNLVHIRMMAMCFEHGNLCIKTASSIVLNFVPARIG